MFKQTWEVSYVGFLAQVLWLNTAAKVMWPYYNQAIGQQVLEQVNPIIAEQLKPVSPLSAWDGLSDHSVHLLCLHGEGTSDLSG